MDDEVCWLQPTHSHSHISSTPPCSPTHYCLIAMPPSSQSPPFFHPCRLPSDDVTVLVGPQGGSEQLFQNFSFFIRVFLGWLAMTRRRTCVPPTSMPIYPNFAQPHPGGAFFSLPCFLRERPSNRATCETESSRRQPAYSRCSLCVPP